MSIEPVRLHRRNFVYRPNGKVPIDFSDVFLPDSFAPPPGVFHFVTVRVAFRTDANSPKSYLVNPMNPPYPPANPSAGNTIWGQGILSVLKASAVGTVFFVPPTPGMYTVEIQPNPAADVTVADFWESKPIVVVP